MEALSVFAAPYSRGLAAAVADASPIVLRDLVRQDDLLADL